MEKDDARETGQDKPTGTNVQPVKFAAEQHASGGILCPKCRRGELVLKAGTRNEMPFHSCAVCGYFED